MVKYIFYPEKSSLYVIIHSYFYKYAIMSQLDWNLNQLKKDF